MVTNLFRFGLEFNTLETCTFFLLHSTSTQSYRLLHDTSEVKLLWTDCTFRPSDTTKHRGLVQREKGYYHHCMYSMTVTLKLLCPNFKRNNIQYNKQKTPKKSTIVTQSYALIEAVITKQ